MKYETLLPDDLIHMAISAIEDLLDHCDPSTDHYCGVWADVPDKLRDALQSGNSAQPVTVPDGWIPVSERMPLTPSADCEYSDIEVSAFDGERVFTAHYAVGSLPQPWGDWVDTNAKITHWQPLPDAPKGV